MSDSVGMTCAGRDMLDIKRAFHSYLIYRDKAGVVYEIRLSGACEAERVYFYCK